MLDAYNEGKPDVEQFEEDEMTGHAFLEIKLENYLNPRLPFKLT